MGRREGKTRKMVEWLRDSRSDNRVLITHSEVERRRILDQYFTDEERPNWENRVLTFSNSLTKLHGRHQQVIGFDNLDLILAGIVSPNQLGPVTVTETEI